jgi:hypothetical protein
MVGVADERRAHGQPKGSKQGYGPRTHRKRSPLAYR